MFDGIQTALFKHQEMGPSLADLLPWAIPPRPGIVQTKRGALIAGFYFNPPDSASTTDAEQGYVSQRANMAMLRMGSGWSSWVDAISYPCAGYPPPEASHFPDPVSRAIDEERRRSFQSEGAHFNNERIFTVCWTPPNKSISRLEKMLYKGGGSIAQNSNFDRYLNSFELILDQIQSECGAALDMRRMISFPITDRFGKTHTQDELVNYLNYCVTGKVHGINLPPQGAFLDTLLGGQDYQHGDIPVMGDEYVAVVALDGYPAESAPNILSMLDSLEFPYRFTQRMIYLDGHHAEKEIQGYMNKWSSKVRPIITQFLNLKNAPINAYAQRMVDDATVAQALASSPLVKFGYYSPTVILRHQDYDVLMAFVKAVTEAIEACGFGSRIEGTNATEALLGSLPGDTRSNVRRPPLHTGNVADLMPLSGVWTGSPHAPNPRYPADSPPLMIAKTTGSIPFFMNLHVEDVGHTLCFGPTGAGKSSLMNSIAMQALRYENMRITCFDHKRGMMATALAMKGRHFEIGESTDPLFCPLSVLETDSDRLWAKEWVHDAFALQSPGVELTPTQSQQINLAVDQLSKKSQRSITDFLLACADQKVREAMRFYSLKGDAGHLFDAARDGVADSLFNVYEMQEIMERGDKISLPLLSYMFRRFERSLNGDPALLFLPEAWRAFSSPVWREKLQAWLRLLRSKNCAVLMDTQKLSDAFRSGMLDLLNESCPTKLYLPNPNAFQAGTDENPGSYEFYKKMGLNDNQISLIKNGTRKQDVYWTSPKGSRMIEPGLTPIMLSIAGLTDETDVEHVKALYREHGEDWINVHLQQKGLNHASLFAA